MSESNSQSHHSPQESEQQIQAVPQINLESIASTKSEDRYKQCGEYMKVLSKDQKIDFDDILQDFNKDSELERRKKRNITKKGINKKPSKIASRPSNKYEFGLIKKKWKAQIDSNIETYKQYLKQEKKAYDGKHKQNLLDLFKVLLDGIFELRDYGKSFGNDLNSNQKKITADQADVCSWVKTLVDNFDKQFKQAEMNHKISSAKLKWEALVKNCKDQSNFQLRRKIIRCKVKPIHVIQNNDEFLMSQQAKQQEKRNRRLLLAEAEKNFDRPLEDQNNRSFEIQKSQQIVELTEPMRSYSVTDLLQKKMSQQKERLQQYKLLVGQETINRLRKRINETLEGTESYGRIMKDFEIKFSSL